METIKTPNFYIDLSSLEYFQKTPTGVEFSFKSGNTLTILEADYPNDVITIMQFLLNVFPFPA